MQLFIFTVSIADTVQTPFLRVVNIVCIIAWFIGFTTAEKDVCELKSLLLMFVDRVGPELHCLYNYILKHCLLEPLVISKNKLIEKETNSSRTISIKSRQTRNLKTKAIFSNSGQLKLSLSKKYTKRSIRFSVVKSILSTMKSYQTLTVVI